MMPAYPEARTGEPPRPQASISYYPGCSLHATGIEFHMSTKAVAEKLDLNLVEPEGWVCCGTSPAHNTNHYRAIKLPMQTLAIAEELGHSYMTMPCAACFSRFRVAMHEVQNDPELRQKDRRRHRLRVHRRHQGGQPADDHHRPRRLSKLPRSRWSSPWRASRWPATMAACSPARPT